MILRRRDYAEPSAYSLRRRIMGSGLSGVLRLEPVRRAQVIGHKGLYIYIYIYIFFVFFSKKGLRVQGLGLKACTLELETYICVRMDSIKP